MEQTKVTHYGYFSAYHMIDEFGKSILRTPQTNPYTYDGFVIWRGGKNEEANHTLYSDRIIREDHEKYDRLCKKHFGDISHYFSDRDAEKIEAFLKDWTGEKNLRLILIMQYCNMSSGYPYWRFDFKS